MDFLELVAKARTCRRFLEAEGLPAGTLEWLVDCARVSPCTKNEQALRFAVAENRAVCAEIFPALRFAGAIPGGGPSEGEHPAGYVVILGETGERARFNAIDMGIAAQTMQLAASTRGIGCCILLSFNPTTVREVLGIPAELEPLLVLAFGMEKEERHIVPLPADGSVKYWRDENNVHYVPKRALAELLVIKK